MTTPAMTPAMTFDLGQLMDADKLRHGPMTLFWNQDEFIPCNYTIDYGTKPKPKLAQRLLRLRLFQFDIRIAPPPDVDLNYWGIGVAKRLGTPWAHEAKPADKAVWLPGWVYARNAGQALGSAQRVFERLDGLKVGQAQVRVVAAGLGREGQK